MDSGPKDSPLPRSNRTFLMDAERKVTKKRRQEQEFTPSSFEITRHRILQDPIERLPPELLIWVIQETLPYSGDPTSQILDLTSVSRKWQRFMCSVSDFWTQIYIEGTKEDLLATIALFVHFSGTSLLRLFVWDYIGPEWQAISHVLKPLSQRIVKLTILGDRLPSLGIQRSAPFTLATSAILQHLGGLHNLRELHFTRSVAWDLSSFKVLDLPLGVRLTSDVVFGSSEAISSGRDFSLFSWVITQTRFIDLAPMLNSLPFAKTLMVTATSKVKRGTLITEFVTGMLPCLTRLYLLEEYSESLRQLVHLSAPKLTHLHLTVGVAKMAELLDLLAWAVRLEYLLITIVGPHGTVSAGVPPENTMVRRLHELSLHSQIESGTAAASITTLSRLLSAFLRIYTSVQRLALFDIPLEIFNISCLGTLTCLRFLSIHRCLVGPGPGPPPSRSISLIHLDADNLDILRYILVPNLVAVQTTLESGDEFTGLKMPPIRKLIITPRYHHTSFRFRLNTLQLPQLHSLHVTIHLDTMFEPISLSRLVEITVHENKHTSWIQGNLFCMSLIYNPEQLPILENLSFNGFVEWDILFNMLERRNLETPGVKAIRTVSLPFVPFVFRASLEALLDGKRTKRPYNESLSMEATREVIFDMTIPGCVLCLKYMWPGCTKYLEEEETFGEMEGDMMFPEYPEPPDEVPAHIRTWIAEHTAAIKIWKSCFADNHESFFRAEHCDRHDGEYNPLRTIMTREID